MARVRTHVVLTVALIASGACARTVAVNEATGSVARVDEIPITTASTSARTHFSVGERLLDVGRPREAREHFRLAVEQDVAVERSDRPHGGFDGALDRGCVALALPALLPPPFPLTAFILTCGAFAVDHKRTAGLLERSKHRMRRNPA